LIFGRFEWIAIAYIAVSDIEFIVMMCTRLLVSKAGLGCNWDVSRSEVKGGAAMAAGDTNEGEHPNYSRGLLANLKIVVRLR
jgi:hypothetical protein